MCTRLSDHKAQDKFGTSASFLSYTYPFHPSRIRLPIVVDTRWGNLFAVWNTCLLTMTSHKWMSELDSTRPRSSSSSGICRLDLILEPRLREEHPLQHLASIGCQHLNTGCGRHVCGSGAQCQYAVLFQPADAFVRAEPVWQAKS